MCVCHNWVIVCIWFSLCMHVISLSLAYALSCEEFCCTYLSLSLPLCLSFSFFLSLSVFFACIFFSLSLIFHYSFSVTIIHRFVCVCVKCILVCVMRGTLCVCVFPQCGVFKVPHPKRRSQLGLDKLAEEMRKEEQLKADAAGKRSRPVHIHTHAHRLFVVWFVF